MSKGMNLKTIKVPVFRTMIVEEEINLFSINREEMVECVCETIQKYNCSNSKKIVIENSGKNYINEIVQITAEKKNMHGSPVVFIQMSAHKTNLGDGYIETSRKIPMTKDVKIGSDHYYIVMYPTAIKGRTKFKRHWNIFLYDDPNKDSMEFIKMTKEMIKEVLKLKIRNLKKKDFYEEISNYSIFNNITANFQTVEYINDQYDAHFKEYIAGGQILSRKIFELKNLPHATFLDMLNSEDDMTIKRRTFNIFVGKKEYKISQNIKKDYQRAKEKYSLLIESLFNESISISEEEYSSNKIYEKDFVIEKLEGVVANYMS